MFEPFSNGWKGAFGYGDLKDENEQLKAELEERKSAGRRDRPAPPGAGRRSARSTASRSTGSKTKVAKVVSGPLTSFEQTVEIDVGSSDGVKKGMAVITGRTSGSGGGVMGKISEVRSNTATVELITESGRRRSASAPRTATSPRPPARARTSRCDVEGIDDATRIEVGDYVYTSGIDRSPFPRRPLRRQGVEGGQGGRRGARASIEVEPSADLTSRYVRVVLKDPPK